MSTKQLEQQLWQAADQLRANSSLKASEYSAPVLGLIFLRYADLKFAVAEKAVQQEIGGSGRRKITPETYHAKGVLYLPETARYDYLLKLPESANAGHAINKAMESPEVIDKFAQLGLTSNRNTELEFTNFLKSEVPKWAAVVKSSGAKAD